MRLTQYLEAVAYAKHLSTGIGKFNYTLHHRAKPCNSTATEVVAVGKTTGKYDAILCIKPGQILVLMPEHCNILMQVVPQCIMHVPVTIRTGKNNNAEFHVMSCLSDGKGKDKNQRGTGETAIENGPEVNGKWRVFIL